MELSVQQLRELLCNGSNAPAGTALRNKRIVVLQRGWVVVGNYSRQGDEILVEGASVIRQWGATKGLGEIAAGGPTSKTVLDPCGLVRAHVASVVLTVDCNEEAWRGK